MNDEMIPEAFDNALERWGRNVWLLHERFDPHWLPSAYIAGLVAAGVRAEHAKEWRGKYPHRLPYVVAFPCPFNHRSEDRRDDARVQIIVEENARWSLDPDSPCPHCTGERLAEWFLLCPRCEADEDSERHAADHPAFGAADVSPLAWIIREFARLADIADARWWIEHTEEALDDSLYVYIYGRERVRNAMLARARIALGAKPPKAIAAEAKPKVSPEEAAAWLDRLTDSAGASLVPPGVTVREMWEAVKDLPERPPKNTLEAALRLRSGTGS